jgi:IS30 family transposase
MAEDLMEKRSVRRLTDAQKGQIITLNAFEYRQARIAPLLSRSESTIRSTLDKCGKQYVLQSRLGRPKKHDITGAVIIAI